MIAQRRITWNIALERAAGWARELGKPLLVFEPLRVGHRWASDRLHRFVIDGMADNASRLAAKGVAYFPYVEPSRGRWSWTARRLGRACGCRRHRRLPGVHAAADGGCGGPASAGAVRAGRRERAVAHAPRRTDVHVRALLPPLPPAHAAAAHRQSPVGATRCRTYRPWSERPCRQTCCCAGRPPPQALLAGSSGLAALPIDHTVPPAALRGGATAADAALEQFLVVAAAVVRGRP